MNSIPQDRRNYMRVKFEHAVKCMTPQVLFEANATNLGLQGLRLLSPLPLEVGTEVAILFSFTPEGDTPFMALAEVVWCEQAEEEDALKMVSLGLRFLNLGRSKEALLRFHIQQLALAGRMALPSPAAGRS